MATITFDKKEIEKFIGKECSTQEIVDAFEMLGMPVDKYDENEITADITNDRVDMFTVEGAGRAIGQLLGVRKPSTYKIADSDKILNVENVECRPYVVAFIAKGVAIDEKMIKSLIMAQEKIHETFGRKRRKIAIGIHDADKVKGNLYYKQVSDIKFVPLDTDYEMNIKEILTTHPKGVEYAHIFNGVSKYPMFMDDEGVLSFPPIINSERTRLTEKTRNLLFDITGTSQHAIRIVANIFATSLAERGAKIENIKIKLVNQQHNQQDNQKDVQKQNQKATPMQDSLIFERKEYLSLKFANQILGIKLKKEEAISLLSKMGLVAREFTREASNSSSNSSNSSSFSSSFSDAFDIGVPKAKNDTILEIDVPPYRADFMHQVDFIEEIAVAYGYENFKPKLPQLVTNGQVSAQSTIDQRIREQMVTMEFVEINSWTLVNEGLLEKALVSKHEIDSSVKIKNPRTQDFTLFRPHLYPSLLHVLSQNKTKGLPIKIFEVGRVADSEGKCMTRLSAAVMAEKADFSTIYSVFNEIKKFAKVAEVYPDEVKFNPENYAHLIDGRFILISPQENKSEKASEASNKELQKEKSAKLDKSSKHKQKIIGWCGEIHPQVIENFGLDYPVAVFEFTLSPDQKERR